jgi:hypothetical protein
VGNHRGLPVGQLPPLDVGARDVVDRVDVRARRHHETATDLAITIARILIRGMQS